MAETISREAWLQQELAIETSIYERAAASSDPDDIRVAELAARRVQLIQGELADLLGPVTWSMRLTGGRILAHSAPIEAVRALYDQVDVLADDFEAEVLVAPSVPGSHVLKFEPAHQLEMVEPNRSFKDLAETVIAFSPQVTPDTDGSAVAERAAELSPVAVRAVQNMMKALAASNLNVEMSLTGDSRTIKARITHGEASLLDLWLSKMSRTTTVDTVEGRLDGWTRGSGTFEIVVAGETIRGRVPARVRAQGVGLRIGDQVRAEIETTITSRPTGPGRKLRLQSISPIET